MSSFPWGTVRRVRYRMSTAKENAACRIGKIFPGGKRPSSSLADSANQSVPRRLTPGSSSLRPTYHPGGDFAISRPLLTLNVHIADQTVREKTCALFLLSFTAEVPMKYNSDPSQGKIFHKFYRVAHGVLYLPKQP